jgi:hypothetical protein
LSADGSERLDSGDQVAGDAVTPEEVRAEMAQIPGSLRADFIAERGIAKKCY